MYRIFKVNGRDILAYPEETFAGKQHVYRFFTGNTIRRQMIRLFLGIFLALRMDKLITSGVESPLSGRIDLDEFLRVLYSKLGLGEADTKAIFPIITFPSMATRKRAYVFLWMDRKILAYVKVSFDQINNEMLRREKEILRVLPCDRFTFNTPDVLFSGNYKSCEYVAYKPLPIFKNSPGELKDQKLLGFATELQAYQHSTHRLGELDWWHKFIHQTNSQTAFFCHDVQLSEDELIPTSLVHGDLSYGNVCVSNNTFWLFDWEASDFQAPFLTDQVVFFLNSHQRLISKDSKKVAIQMGEIFLSEGNEESKKNLALALAYLATTSRNDARVMVEVWEHVIGHC